MKAHMTYCSRGHLWDRRHAEPCGACEEEERAQLAYQLGKLEEQALALRIEKERLREQRAQCMQGLRTLRQDIEILSKQVQRDTLHMLGRVNDLQGAL